MLPKGYHVISSTETRITIGMFDFGLMGKVAEPTIEYNGKKYYRGSMAVVPDRFSNSCCSCREYSLDKDKFICGWDQPQKTLRKDKKSYECQ